MTFYNKKLLIFDLDGTLIDSVPDLANSINLMLEELNHATFPTERIRGWVGNGAKMLVKRAILSKDNVSEDFEGELLHTALQVFFKKYEENACDDTLLYDHVESALKKLHQKGYILTLATNKPEKFVAPILSHFNLTHYFTMIIGGDTLSEKKPDPLPLLHICKETDITPENSVMIGDSKNDILAAQAAQMHSIGVTYGYNYGQNINVYNPTMVISNFNQILDYL